MQGGYTFPARPNGNSGVHPVTGMGPRRKTHLYLVCTDFAQKGKALFDTSKIVRVVLPRVGKSVLAGCAPLAAEGVEAALKGKGDGEGEDGNEGQTEEGEEDGP